MRVAARTRARRRVAARTRARRRDSAAAVRSVDGNTARRASAPCGDPGKAGTGCRQIDGRGADAGQTCCGDAAVDAVDAAVDAVDAAVDTVPDTTGNADTCGHTRPSSSCAASTSRCRHAAPSTVASTAAHEIGHQDDVMS